MELHGFLKCLIFMSSFANEYPLAAVTINDERSLLVMGLNAHPAH